MKKVYLILLPIIFSKCLISMQVYEDIREKSIFNLPNEIVFYILEQEAREIIDNWNDVFKIPKIDLSLIENLSKTCTKFRILCKESLILLNNYKKRKYEKLLENLKSESLEAYKNNSQKELDNKLINILNKLLNFEQLKDAIKLIFAGANVDIKNRWGSTTLIFAARGGYKNIVEILLNKKADVNAQNNNGENSLICAIDNGDKDIVEMLLNAGVNVNTEDIDGYNALMWASISGRRDIVEILLNKKVDINAKNNFYKHTALMLATMNNHEDIVEVLLNNGVEVNSQDIMNLLF